MQDMSENTFRHIYLRKLSPKHYFRIDAIGPSLIDGPFEIRLLPNGTIIELRTKEKLASIENQRTKYNVIKLCFKIMGMISYKMTSCLFQFWTKLW